MFGVPLRFKVFRRNLNQQMKVPLKSRRAERATAGSAPFGSATEKEETRAAGVPGGRRA